MGCGFAKEAIQDILRAEEASHESSAAAFAALDARTRAPHLLIEVRSFGFVEISGKDTGGIYQKLDDWLVQTWRAKRLEQELAEVINEQEDCLYCGRFHTHYELHPLQDHRRLCDMSYTLGSLREDGTPGENEIYRYQRDEYESNMGKLTMELAHFMTNQCGWTLQGCESGSVGKSREIREQQMIFKAPQPLNLIAPLIMVQRRKDFIVVNGPNVAGIYGQLQSFATSKWGAQQIEADPAYCDLKFKSSAFDHVHLVDFMVKTCQWTLVAASDDTVGPRIREQQFVFRNDELVQHGVDIVTVELFGEGSLGFVELLGLDKAADLRPHLADFLENKWKCKKGSDELTYKCPKVGFCLYNNKMLTNNYVKRTLELADFLAEHGWALLLCNRTSLLTGLDVRSKQVPRPEFQRKRQLIFTRVTSGDKAKEPLLIIELRTEPINDWPRPRYLQYIEVCGKNTANVYERLQEFFVENMGARCLAPALHCDAQYSCDKFCLRPSSLHEHGCLLEKGTFVTEGDGFLTGETNVGKWAVRICDYMVDHLGEWDLVACNSDNVTNSFLHGGGDLMMLNGITAREMQMVFRHRSQGQAVVPSAEAAEPLGPAPAEAPQMEQMRED